MAKIPDDLIHNYPPDAHGPRQCTFFINKCRSCDSRFKPSEILCGSCGKPRPRCGAVRQPDTDACRAHTPTSTVSLYTAAAAKIGQTQFEEALERDDRSVDAEYTMAKLALANIMGDKDIPERLKLKDIKAFFEIAEKRKKVESGAELNLKFDDKTASAIRRRIKIIVQTMRAALEEFVPDDATRKKILERVAMGAKLTANTKIDPDKQDQPAQHFRPAVRSLPDDNIR